MSVLKIILAGIRWLRDSPRFVTHLVTVKAARTILSRLSKPAPAIDPSPEAPRQLLADVSVIAQYDAGTGIQRVVRELLRQLIAHPPPGYVVRPVYATQWRGFRYADHHLHRLMGQQSEIKAVDRIVVRPGDIFLGMDFAAHILPRYPFLLGRWKASGVKFFFIVYDLLPVLHPEWFTSSTVNAYRDWIRTVATFADGAACISRSVANELEQWLAVTYGEAVNESISKSWFHLSGDISSASSSSPSQLNVSAHMPVREGIRPTILMVGTVEPRKGYEQTLLAFEMLWKEGNEARLVIVGRSGWKMDHLVQRLRNHQERGKRLIWHENASDQVLRELYESASGLLMASEGEGFGLPLVEIARYGKPILVRDLPVFREIAGVHAQYFASNAPEKLAMELQKWISLIKEGKAPGSGNVAHLQWRDSARQLIDCLTIA